MSGILGEDILSGEKKTDEERGELIGGGLLDFGLFVVTVLTFGSTSGASAAGGTGARAAGLLARGSRLLGRVGEGGRRVGQGLRGF